MTVLHIKTACSIPLLGLDQTQGGPSSPRTLETGGWLSLTQTRDHLAGGRAEPLGSREDYTQWVYDSLVRAFQASNTPGGGVSI